MKGSDTARPNWEKQWTQAGNAASEYQQSRPGKKMAKRKRNWWLLISFQVRGRWLHNQKANCLVTWLLRFLHPQLHASLFKLDPGTPKSLRRIYSATKTHGKNEYVRDNR